MSGGRDSISIVACACNLPKHQKVLMILWVQPTPLIENPGSSGSAFFAVSYGDNESTPLHHLTVHSFRTRSR
jgi:hypothetical protein